MKTHTRTALLALACISPAIVAWTGARAPLVLQPQSRLWVAGSSTVRSWECKATAFDATVDAKSLTLSDLMLKDAVVQTVEVKVPTEKMDCGNGTMNEHMLKALKAKDNPVIDFKLLGYQLTPGTNGAGTLTGNLTIGGRTNQVAITAKAADANGQLHVTGTYELKMSDYGLKPPTLMLGTLKVGDAVKVNFDLYLKG